MPTCLKALALFVLGANLCLAESSSPTSPKSAPAPATPATTPVGTPVSGPGRQIAVGDNLRYQVVEDRDPAVELTVSNTGMVDLPYYGTIQAAGRTIDELRTAITTALETELYVHASVRLQILTFSQGAVNRGRVHLSGQVRRVGPFEINLSEKPTLGQTILAAGGLADFGDPRNVRIVRKNSEGATRTIVVDLREVLTKGKIDKDVELQDGDFIIVDERMINW
jgi:polysaccharide export outer membrane protein